MQSSILVLFLSLSSSLSLFSSPFFCASVFVGFFLLGWIKCTTIARQMEKWNVGNLHLRSFFSESVRGRTGLWGEKGLSLICWQRGGGRTRVENICRVFCWGLFFPQFRHFLQVVRSQILKTGSLKATHHVVVALLDSHTNTALHEHIEHWFFSNYYWLEFLDNALPMKIQYPCIRSWTTFCVTLIRLKYPGSPKENTKESIPGARREDQLKNMQQKGGWKTGSLGWSYSPAKKGVRKNDLRGWEGCKKTLEAPSLA